MNLLSVHGLTIRIGPRTLCQDLNVTLAGGQRWAILGANGSGKTTLLHTLAGLRAASEGMVRLGDRDILALPARERARQIGILFQDAEAGMPNTALELALSGRHPHLGRFAWEGEQDLAIARDALARVGLAGFEQRLVGTLSGGERRRAEFAALLAQVVPVWLLDEPTSHLDLASQTGILALARDHAVPPAQLSVFVLHDINQALQYASHGILLFGDGRWRAGVLADIATGEVLEQLYGCELREVRSDDARYFIAR